MRLKPKMLQDETRRSLKMMSDVVAETRKDAQTGAQVYAARTANRQGKDTKEMDHCSCLLYERTNSN